MRYINKFVLVWAFTMSFALVIYGLTVIYKKQPQPQLPTDNELIEINDSTYYRINVRIDTTYFYNYE